MPLGMQRHIDNTSRYDTKTDVLWWRVEWLFLLHDGTELRAASYRVPDDTGVAAAAGEALAYLTAPAAAGCQSEDTGDEETPPPHVALQPATHPAATGGSVAGHPAWCAAAAAWHASPLSSTAAAPAPTLLPPKQRRIAHARGAQQAKPTPPPSEPSTPGGTQNGTHSASAEPTASPVAPTSSQPDGAAADAVASGASSVEDAAEAAPDPAAEVAALPKEPLGLFLQHPYAERGEHVYHSVPGPATLRAAVWGRALVEFPCFAVCLSEEQTRALSLRPASDTPVPDHTQITHDDSDDDGAGAPSHKTRPRSAAAGADAGMPPPRPPAAALPSAGHAGSVRWAHNTFAPPVALANVPPTPVYGSSSSSSSSAAPASSAAAFSAAAAAVAQRTQQTD